MSISKNYTIEELKEIIKNSYSIAQVCRAVGIEPKGGNYKTINNKIRKYNIDISHFTGKGWNVGLKFNPNPAKPLEEILIENSDYQSFKLLKRLLKEEYKTRICECCNKDQWLDNPIPIELHHINGINNDNRIENLQILCPNCHALTNNYRGKNMKK